MNKYNAGKLNKSPSPDRLKKSVNIVKEDLDKEEGNNDKGEVIFELNELKK